MKVLLILLFLSAYLTAGVQEDLVKIPQRDDWYYISVDETPICGFSDKTIESDPRGAEFIDNSLISQIINISRNKEMVRIELCKNDDVLERFEISEFFIQEKQNKNHLVLKLMNLLDDYFGNWEFRSRYEERWEEFE